MLQFLLDTDHLMHYQKSHPSLLRQMQQHADEYGLSAVSVEESLKGRLAHVAQARDGAERVSRYALLLDTLQLLQKLPLVPFDQACEAEFQHLRSLRIRVGTQDLKIAATALVHKLTLLTCNRRDFLRIPGLAIDDWSV
jgi:tRNA(fMet)-specific endonuclease VapC